LGFVSWPLALIVNRGWGRAFLFVFLAVAGQSFCRHGTGGFAQLFLTTAISAQENNEWLGWPILFYCTGSLGWLALIEIGLIRAFVFVVALSVGSGLSKLRWALSSSF
jgi:hypothetical protein